MKCKFCGASINESGEGIITCPYCGGEFEGEKEVVTAKRSSGVRHRKNEGVSVFDSNINSVLEIIWNPTMFTKVSGSGLLVDEHGYALTNAHVVSTDDGKPTPKMQVKIAGESVTASVVCLGDNKAGHGNGVDLALIKLSRVPTKAKPVTFANFDTVRIGEQVFVIGNSLGDGTCITAGIISDKQRTIGGHTVLMTDCAINGGNSGGPIFNADGRVIGVICSSRIQQDGSATEGMNYAVPINIASDFLEGKHVAVKVAPGTPNVNYKVAANKSGPRCPKCGSSTTDVENGIAYCYDCDHEWGA